MMIVMLFNPLMYWVSVPGQSAMNGRYLEGEAFFGLGDTFDESKLMKWSAGDFIVHPDRPNFKVNNRLEGTPEENTAAVHGTTATFGTWSVDEASTTLIVRNEGGMCKRRSNNPSLNRPGFRSRRSKNPAADSLFALSRQRAGDEERGRLFEGSACGSH